MSDLIEQTWQRMRHTPVGDALRGRITGRLNWQGRLKASSLTDPLKDLVRDVTRRTRLWRIEKAEVVDELIAHFEDGLGAGETTEHMIERFGDSRAAARLIRRSMRRKRSTFWHAMNGLRWLCVAMIAFYAISAIYFFAGEPNVKVNYVAELNRHVITTPIDQRAWPLYSKVIPQLETDEAQRSFEGPNGPINLFDLKPGQPHWDELKKWLEDQQPALETAREAASKPAMGFVFGPGGSAYDKTVWPERRPAESIGNPLLLSILLPHLNGLRMLADVFVADMRLAREQGDGERVVRNVDAMYGIADQLLDQSVLVQQLVALSIRDRARSSAAEIVAHDPGLLSDDQLQHLAHRFARPAEASEIFDLTLERAMFYDIVQRSYTDDGHGDGRLTPDGARLIDRLGNPTLRDTIPLGTALMATPPALLASRREVVALYDRWMARAEANLRRPARDPLDDLMTKQFAALDSSPVQQLRYGVLLKLTPSLNRLSVSAARYLGQRDGLLIGIALELYKRRHGGSYPDTLNALAPSLLPHVPVDRMTGGPLHYRITEGKPLVYSVGVDRDDDGGHPPSNRDGQPDSLLAADWQLNPASTVVDGDWVLYGHNE